MSYNGSYEAQRDKAAAHNHLIQKYMMVACALSSPVAEFEAFE
jgi:hypothetical protein